eukprot:267168-Pyramimonas_sp.AAC.1
MIEAQSDGNAPHFPPKPRAAREPRRPYARGATWAVAPVPGSHQISKRNPSFLCNYNMFTMA